MHFRQNKIKDNFLSTDAPVLAACHKYLLLTKEKEKLA